MSDVTSIERYSDPLRKGGVQAVICAQLVCAVCDKDLSGVGCNGIIDLQTGRAYCGPDHWTQRPLRKQGRTRS